MVNGVALVTVTADGLSNVRRVDLHVDGVREQADYRGPFLFAWAAFTLPPAPTPCRPPSFASTAPRSAPRRSAESARTYRSRRAGWTNPLLMRYDLGGVHLSLWGQAAGLRTGGPWQLDQRDDDAGGSWG
jgi:hypothetical protein